MNDQTPFEVSDRSKLAAGFFSRMYRWKRMFFDFWWLPVLLAALGGGVQYWLLFDAPPVYVSVSEMIVNVKLASTATALYMEELNNFLGTQAFMIQDRSVAERARTRVLSANPTMRTSPVSLQVSVSPKTSAFILRAEGGDREYTRAWLDAVMDEYIDRKKQMRQSASDTALSGLTDELTRLDRELQKGREDAINFAATNRVVLLQGNNAANYLEMLTRKLADLKLEAQLLNMLTLDQNLRRQQDLAQQTTATSGNNAGHSATATPTGGETNSPATEIAKPKSGTPGLVGPEGEYLKADQQIQLMEAQLQDLGIFLRPKHPKIIALKEEIDRTKRLLEIFRQQSEAQLKSRQRTLEVEIQNQEAEVREWENKAVDESKVVAVYSGIKENNLRLKEMYNSLLSTSRTIDVEKEISPESLTVYQQASEAAPVDPGLPRHVIFGALGGFGLGMMFLLFRDRLDDRPATIMELNNLFDETVLGQIPLISKKGKKSPVPLLQPEDDRHAFSEAYCSLRSALLYMAVPGKRPKCILVTSAIPNDGKSMTAANLAITVAEAGSTVLLVDADLRKGHLHSYFNLPVEPGLAEVLAGETSASAAITSTARPNLFLLPRGITSHNPGRLFLSTATDALVQELAGKFDLVVFDSAPIIAADDVANLAPKMDGTIVVVRAGFTPGRVARAALELLYLRQVTVMGLVFNAIESESGEYYYYKYSDYYGYGRKQQREELGAKSRKSRASEKEPKPSASPAPRSAALPTPPIETPLKPASLGQPARMAAPVMPDEPVLSESLSLVTPDEPLLQLISPSTPVPESFVMAASETSHELPPAAPPPRSDAEPEPAPAAVVESPKSVEAGPVAAAEPIKQPATATPGKGAVKNQALPARTLGSKSKPVTRAGNAKIAVVEKARDLKSKTTSKTPAGTKVKPTGNRNRG